MFFCVSDSGLKDIKSETYGRSKLRVGAPMKDIIHTLLVTFCAQQREGGLGGYIGGGDISTTMDPHLWP